MKTILYVLLTLLLYGCAETQPLPQQDTQGKFQVWLQRSIGYATVADAVRMFGHPRASVDAGDVISVLWADESRSGVLVPMPWIGVVPGPIIEAPPHGWRLELVFDRQSKVLRGGKYREW